MECNLKKQLDKIGTIWNRAVAYLEGKNTFVMWCACILYKCLLDLYYLNVMHPVWYSSGLGCNPDFVRYVLSWVLLVAGYVGMPKEENSNLGFFFQIQWFLTVMPMLTLYVFDSDQTSTIYMGYVFAVIIVENILVQRLKNITPVKLKTKADIRQHFTVALAITAIACVAIIILWNSFEGLRAFDFEYIYKMREKLEFPRGFGYIEAWVTRIVIPFLYIKCLSEKKYVGAALALGMQVFLFMILGYKFLVLEMVVFTGVFIIWKLKIPVKAIAFGLNLLVFIGLVSYKMESYGTHSINLKINALLGDRTLFIPALYKFRYYNFFSEHPKVWFSNGLIGKCLGETNLYKYSLGYTIDGWHRGGTMLADFNTGYLGEAYAQMGFCGMMLMGILLVIIISFINSYSRYMPDAILLGFIGYIAIVMNDGSLLTACITGGIWLIILICMIYSRKERDYG